MFVNTVLRIRFNTHVMIMYTNVNEDYWEGIKLSNVAATYTWLINKSGKRSCVKYTFSATLRSFAFTTNYIVEYDVNMAKTVRPY